MQENRSIVMVVDDQPDFVEGIRLILEEEGYEVWTADNGENAFDKLKDAYVNNNGENGEVHLPDLILSDVMMPVMDGYTFYEKVRENEHFDDIPFTFLTAKTDIVDIQRGKELGVEDYLTKPCVPDVLLASVRGQIRQGVPKHKQKQRQAEEENSMRMGMIALIAVAVIFLIVLTIALTLMMAQPTL